MERHAAKEKDRVREQRARDQDRHGVSLLRARIGSGAVGRGGNLTRVMNIVAIKPFLAAIWV
jgi:hypothetical protein